MRVYRSILALLLVACFGGCNRGHDERFIGKWTFDRDYTTEHIPKELLKKPADWSWKESSPSGSPSSEAAAIAANVNGMMNNTLKPMLTEQLVTQMDGQTFTLTPKLVTDSSGETRTYSVIERATADTWSIKLSNGDIWALTLEEGRIVMPTTGSVHFKLYFKRTGQ